MNMFEDEFYVVECQCARQFDLMCITFKNRKNKVCPYCRSKNIKVFRCIKESRVKEEIKELERTLKHLNASVVKKSVNVFLNRLEIKKVKKNGKTTCNSTKDN